MRVDNQGKLLLKEWEGLLTKVYTDSGGALTIGIGHCLTRSERTSGKLIIDGQPVDYREGLSEPQCWALLAQDLEDTEALVNDAVTVQLTQNQFNALASFALNVGTSAFRQSTLLQRLNQGLYDQVPLQLRRWVYDNGVVVRGLINRREKEISLWHRIDTNQA